MRALYRKVISAAEDLLWPRRCPYCHEAAPFGKEICPECAGRLPVIRGARCGKCGKPVESFETLCDDCRKTEHVYTEGIGIFRYDEAMRESMAQLKFKGRREYGRTLGHLAGRAAALRIAKWKPDALVPVPMHPGKMKTRGYNQASEIAGGVSDVTGIKVREDLLLRVRETKAMKELSPAERRDNLRNAFRAGSGSASGMRILLVDDIYTTGATVDAASGVLLHAGAEQIFFLAVCIGQGFMVQF